ncbi:MAG: 16S rRNA (cytosine(1402)-N(4))-methyltransferase RsmH [Pyrinomonadaceae bacterium]
MPEIEAEKAHKPVLLDEVLQILRAESGGVFVDCTLGLGGHTEAILNSSPSAKVIGIDRDADALQLAKARLAQFGDRVRFVKANFSQIREIVSDQGGQISGIVADLGVSSMQLDSETRGFSFRFDAPLDMRMSLDDGQTVAELLGETDEKELADIIYRYGEERFSRRIAKWIVERRENGEPITTTFELAELVRRAVRTSPKDRTHPATRTFQALRIAVNGELEILERFVFDAAELLKTAGTLAAITFHSLEDRIVKHAFQRLAGRCDCPPRLPTCVCGAKKTVEILTKKPILPSEDEKQDNPRSRSAKLRACRKLN